MNENIDNFLTDIVRDIEKLRSTVKVMGPRIDEDAVTSTLSDISNLLYDLQYEVENPVVILSHEDAQKP